MAVTKIGIVGLGLIGASLAMATKQNTPHTVFGYDICPETMEKASKIIDSYLTAELLPLCDIIIIALYPQAAVDYIKQNASLLKKDCLVIDCCGVKERVCTEIPPIAAQHGFAFIGGHPMAGIEHSGIDHAFAQLFSGATMILCPTDNRFLQQASSLFLSLGFGRINLSTWQEHDKIIAYTSQLAHIVSSAYIKCDGALMQKGFSAGSFRDMTRVARLNEYMWTELFFENRQALLGDIAQLIEHMHSFQDALLRENKSEMLELLRQGRLRKELVEDEQNNHKS